MCTNQYMVFAFIESFTLFYETFLHIDFFLHGATAPIRPRPPHY